MRTITILLLPLFFLSCRDQIDDANELMGKRKYGEAITKLEEIPKDSKKWKQGIELHALCNITIADSLYNTNNLEGAIKALATVYRESAHYASARTKQSIYEKELRIRNGSLANELTTAKNAKRLGDAIMTIYSLLLEFRETSEFNEIKKMLEPLVARYLDGMWALAHLEQFAGTEFAKSFSFTREKTFEMNYQFAGLGRLNFCTIEGEWDIDLRSWPRKPTIVAYPQKAYWQSTCTYPSKYSFMIARYDDADALFESSYYEDKDIDEAYWLRVKPSVRYQNR